MDLIHQTYSNYISNPKYVYQSCKTEWIVILEKIDDTHTNESRANIYYSNHAVVRASHLNVILIFNKFNPTVTVTEIKSSIWPQYYYDDGFLLCGSFIFKVNDLVYSDSFNDNDLDTIRSPGIHYYKSIETAFYLELDLYKKTYTGQLVGWYPNGQKSFEGDFINGLENGKWIGWYESGQKHYEQNYIDGFESGHSVGWYENDLPLMQLQKCYEGDYLNEKKIGTWVMWDKNGGIIETKCY